jgi:hypothetical protein
VTALQVQLTEKEKEKEREREKDRERDRERDREVWWWCGDNSTYPTLPYPPYLSTIPPFVVGI